MSTHKQKANHLVTRAVRNGELIRPKTCSACGGNNRALPMHGHHDDYTKPLDVIWLCAKCHTERHRELGDIDRWNYNRPERVLSDENKSQLNVLIPTRTKKRLIKLAEQQQRTQTVVVKRLIDEAYLEECK